MVDLGGVICQSAATISTSSGVTSPGPQSDPRRTLAEAIEGADVMIGLSAGNLVSPQPC